MSELKDKDEDEDCCICLEKLEKLKKWIIHWLIIYHLMIIF